ncbi:hypothetical protein B0J13DRAFT_541737 [Dactylonectria estremocensis]|uniref:N-acetyltransferase domain-containing protein n=1 Tax=Dactylonectria estremocensis TaxID=1079267 RepID=A0A9P9JEP5_9HYPO|nr:hypothetical protein B0J13DRAFT_541737 [Dactylonectria estremocensis]
MAFIRLYEKRDFHATAHICRETLPPSLNLSPDGRRLAPYLWTHQYTHLCPSTCFVLDDGHGMAVGYCIGCPDIPAFVGAYPSYTAAVLDPSPDLPSPRPDPLAPPEPWTGPDGSVNGACLVQLAYDPRRLLLGDARAAAVAARYRATLHIDLLEAWQAQGWGRRLLERTVGALAEQRCAGGGSEEANPGVWVGVADDNAKVVPFYERMGFRLWEEAHDDDDGDGDEAEAFADAAAAADEDVSTKGSRSSKGDMPKRKVKVDGSIVLVREFSGAAAGSIGGAD